MTPGGLKWQVCTNHRIWGSSKEENDQECSRYQTVSNRLEAFDGSSPSDYVLDTMRAVSLKNWTMWTTVFDLSSKDFRVVYKQQFADQYRGQVHSH